MDVRHFFARLNGGGTSPPKNSPHFETKGEAEHWAGQVLRSYTQHDKVYIYEAIAVVERDAPPISVKYLPNTYEVKGISNGAKPVKTLGELQEQVDF